MVGAGFSPALFARGHRSWLPSEMASKP